MKRNMGPVDRLVRVIIAAIAINFYSNGTVTGAWGIVLITAAVIFLLTSFVGTCPLYIPFGIRTLQKKPSHK